MKSICLVIHDLSGGGAEKAVINLAEALYAEGHKVNIITLFSGVEHRIDTKRIKVDCIEAKFWHQYIEHRSMRKLRNVIMQNKLIFSIQLKDNIRKLRSKINDLGPFDIVISNLPMSDFLCIAAKIDNLYCCIHRDIQSENVFPHPSKVMMLKFKQALWNRRTCHFYKNQNIITVSEELLERTLALGIKPKTITNIYNIFNFEKICKLSSKYKVKEDNYIIYVGRPSPEKNLRMLIKAYEESGISSKLLLLGKWPEKNELQDFVNDKGMRSRVIFKGFISNPYPYMKKAKALILASNMEGLPTVLIEALILGTPVVSTSCPTGPKEILTGELAEFLSPPGDMKALAKNIRKVIEHPPQIRQEHIAKFHKDVNIGKYLDLLS